MEVDVESGANGKPDADPGGILLEMGRADEATRSAQSLGLPTSIERR
jgi:hypothetical protein